MTCANALPVSFRPRIPAVASLPRSVLKAVAPAAAQASKVLEDGRQEARAAADPIGPLPQVDDPSVARRRAEVLDGAAPLDDRRGEAPVEGRPPMSPEERLRKLYSLAEEMELLYVSKMTR